MRQSSECVATGILSEDQYDRQDDQQIRAMRAAIEDGSFGEQEENEKKDRRKG